ncbi:MAG: hypothetical protein M0D54_19235 [Hyphomonadaceae bacterium JAD_PAG50586_4]|nr:MAG: hypothetical protein M0D54_19235 [Hyphomonadaceae bacterium JAD_PAG50586_4]
MALPIVLLVVLQIVFTLEREREDVERFALSRAERVMALADAQVQADVAVMRVLATADPLERNDWPLAYARVREVASLNPHWRNVIIADRSTNEDVLSLGRPYSTDHLPLDAATIDHHAIAREGRGCPCLYLYQPIGADGRYELIVAIAPDTLRDLLMRHLPEDLDRRPRRSPRRFHRAQPTARRTRRNAGHRICPHRHRERRNLRHL